MIRHKTTVSQIWETLDRKFGSIDVSQAQLLRDLKKLPQYPRSEEEELSNINAILLYTDLARRHKRTKQFINQPFIWEMTSHLKWVHKNNIMEQRLFKPKQFINYLRDIQESLDVIIRTRPEARKLGNGSQGKPDGGDNAPKQVNN